MKLSYILNVAMALIGTLLMAQRPTPAPTQKHAIAITGGIIHTGTGEVLNDTTILFEDGIITGFNKPIPENAEIINAKGHHIYPGFILVNNTLGLIEVGATKATVDFAESNDFTPEVRTLIAFNTDSHIIPTVRTNGILMTQPVMKRGIITGTSSIMNLDSWNWEDGVIIQDNVLHIIWPTNYEYSKQEDDLKAEKARNEALSHIYNLFQRAKGYDTNGIKDYKLEALAPIYSGEKKLFIQVPNAAEGLEVLAFLKKYEIPDAVFLGGSNLIPILDYIKESNLPLIIHRPHSLPSSDSASPNLPYEFAKMVSDKGILYGLDYSGDMEYHGNRNLPFVAGTTVAYGVSKENALQSITYNIAKIVGIDDRYGSLEIGKQATLFISEGDALDPLTNRVTHAFIDGRKIDLNNKQKELYKRYKDKFNLD